MTPAGQPGQPPAAFYSISVRGTSHIHSAPGGAGFIGNLHFLQVDRNIYTIYLEMKDVSRKDSRGASEF